MAESVQQKSIFVKGKMNKSVDERILPVGEYIDALNARLGSTEDSEVGALENSKGNTLISDINYDGSPLSDNAKCIGAYADESTETVYWFITDPGVVDLIVSYNTSVQVTTYHIVSVSVLNFSVNYLITGVNLIAGLLFWTDNLNPPRRINIKSNYLQPSGGVDQITDEEINVIVKPPTTSPQVVLSSTEGSISSSTSSSSINQISVGANQADIKTILTDSFLTFSYRYQYVDSEWSALSQFSLPAFESKDNFQLDINTYLNEGMENKFNTASVSFNTGGPLVKSIQVCFKDSVGNVIKIIDNYNKKDLGWGDNLTQEIQLKTDQVYGVLPSDQLLRLYDNVPHVALAQTEMSNRLMYGNYSDGYDLTTTDGDAVNLDYVSSFSNAKSGSTESSRVTDDPSILSDGNPTGSTTNSTYNIQPSGTTTIDETTANLNFSDVLFKSGSLCTIELNVNYNSAGNVNENSAVLNLNRPLAVSGSIGVSFTILNDYPTAFDFFTSTEFAVAIGTNVAPSSVNPIATSCTGTSLMDELNCFVKLNPSTNSVGGASITPVNSSTDPVTALADGTGQGGFSLSISPTGNVVSIQLPMMVYNVGGNAGTYSSESWQISTMGIAVNTGSSRRSLHSNRDYDIAMVYMDEYNRSSNALVSKENSVNISSFYSQVINKIQTNIPISQKAPSWAKRYKFAIKPSATTYDTIYIVYVYIDPENVNDFYCLVEGQSAAAINAGDRYIVKRDALGAIDSYIEAVCLEKSTSLPASLLGLNPPPPIGVYAKFNPGDGYAFTKETVSTSNTLADSQNLNDIFKSNRSQNIGNINSAENCSNVVLDVKPAVSGFVNVNGEIDIPNVLKTGTSVRIRLRGEVAARVPGIFGGAYSAENDGFLQVNTASLNKYSEFDKTVVLQADYTTIKDMIEAEFAPADGNGDHFFFSGDMFYTGNEGDKIPFKFISSTNIVDDGGACTSLLPYLNQGVRVDKYHVVSVTGQVGSTTTDPVYTLAVRLHDQFASRAFIQASPFIGTRDSKVFASIEVSNVPDGTIVLESIPAAAADDLYYEGSQSFEITNTGTHKGSIQNQEEWTFGDNFQNNAYRLLAGLPVSPNGHGGNLAFSTNPAAPFNLSGIVQPFQVGQIVNIAQTNLSPTNPQYNGNFEIVEIPDQYTIVLNTAFGVATSVEGGVASAEAIIVHDFFNCYCWQNGVESSRIRDGLVGDTFNLGERAYTVGDGEYKRADRFASITYSGVYNDNNNLNRLNEFNLGVFNYKDLQKTFGEIGILDGRKTDILVLQEDKISYVTASKENLTTADGSGIVTAAPAVLGSEIARLENYGISFNPESFAKYGGEKYFTDQKRGAVLQLTGSAYTNESLSVISLQGMRSWFRDLFIDSSKTQKLGGYDPYMNEYVLSSTDTLLPSEIQTFNCGVENQVSLGKDNSSYNVLFSSAVGSVSIPYTITSGTIKISVTYDGATTTTGSVTTSGTFTFNKTSLTVNTALVSIEVISSTASYSTVVECVAANVLNVIKISLNNQFTGVAPTIHSQNNWSSGSFNTRTFDSPVTFTNETTGTFRVAQYEKFTNKEGVLQSPITTSTVRMLASQQGNDTFVFDAASGNKLKWLISTNEYTNTYVGLINLLQNAGLQTLVTSNPSSSLNEGAFTYDNTFIPPATFDEYLYLIYDYRTNTSVTLEFGSSGSIVCGGTGAAGTYYINATTPADATVIYTDLAGTTPAVDGYYLYENPDPTVADTYWLRQVSGVVVQVSLCAS